MRVSQRLAGFVARVPAKLQKKLLGAFLVLVLMLIALEALGLQMLRGVNERTEALINLEHKIAAYREVQHEIVSQLYNESSALLTSDPSSVESALGRLKEFGHELDRLPPIAADEVELLTRARQDYDRFAAAVTHVIGLIREGKLDEARAAQAAEARPLADRLEQLTNQLLARAEASLGSEIEASRRSYDTAQGAVIAFTLCAILMALMLGSTISRSLIEPITEIEKSLSALAGGDFNQNVTVLNRDELGALADNINRTSEQLGALYHQVEAASQHKSTFLANMSHELRTPLNAVIGYSEMLYETAEEEGHDEYLPDLKKIRAAGRHLLELINDVLDLSKIEAGRMDLYFEEVDLETLIAEVRAIIGPLAEVNGNTLEIACPPGLGTFHTDRTKLKQSLLNLLSNATKFTHGGRVSLEIASAAGKLAFIISDTGIGMSEEQLGRLFQAFSQADASTTRRYGGTGLGLTITKHFCEMLGGTITVDSVPGQGSTFTINLPDQRAVAELVEETAAAPEPVENANGALVMVVDDDPHARRLLSATVRRAGCRVIEASDGPSALALARERHPDAITLDILMPRMDGWAVLAAFKSDSELCDIPVLVVTVLADRGIALSLGAAEFLTKPVDRARLAALIKQHVRGRGVVLVVDDEEEARLLARRHLERLGCDVAEARDGVEAVEWLSDNPRPALILLDLAMPRMDGFGFLEALGEREAWRDIPVVILTAMHLGAVERELLSVRAREVVEKGADALEPVLQRLLTAKSGEAVAAG
jgi:signal transduction histidine kinase/CheY-like chemotaxis protein